MQRRLAVAATLVHARWIGVEHRSKEIDAIKPRRRTRIRYGPRLEKPGSYRTIGGVKRMKPTCPPVAAAVRIRAQSEQRVDNLHVTAPRDVYERGRIEAECRRIDRRREFVAKGNEPPQLAGVVVLHCASKPFLGGHHLRLEPGWRPAHVFRR